MNWYALPARATVSVPRSKLRIEGLHGLETERAARELDLTRLPRATARLSLKRFYDTGANGLRSGNTHLHLMKLTHAEAIRYLEVVPRTDDLDLLFVSHLRRIPGEQDYVTNAIVENSLAGGELQQMSRGHSLFGLGEEHRHNFKVGEGYGHVMLLDIIKLIRPVSIGPAIMNQGTDGIPLQRGILEARDDGATVIWCHNAYGYEDIPNWVAGLLHAQNIYDGPTKWGSYADTFYRYLNLGMHIPFSTGTDWFVYDFSRVYVPVEGELTTKKWLRGLRAGKSFITNGTFLELEAGGNRVGDTIHLSRPSEIQIAGRALGRQDFRGLELIHNGQVVHTVQCTGAGGHFEARLNWTLPVKEPGWIALRIPLDNNLNELDRRLFAHTSPIYIELAGQRIFRIETAEELLKHMRQEVKVIQEQGVFADQEERNAVFSVHRDAVELLKVRIAQHRDR